MATRSSDCDSGVGDVVGCCVTGGGCGCADEAGDGDEDVDMIGDAAASRWPRLCCL